MTVEWEHDWESLGPVPGFVPVPAPALGPVVGPEQLYFLPLRCASANKAESLELQVVEPAL